MAIVAAVIAFICLFCAAFAGWVAPHNPFDLTTLELSDARLPPAWSAEGSLKYPLGTDDQGRCVLSTILYGLRISLGVGFVESGEGGERTVGPVAAEDDVAIALADGVRAWGARLDADSPLSLPILSTLAPGTN